MSTRLSGPKIGLMILVLSFMAQGCASGPNADRGTVVGATLGSILGGVIGHQSGHTVDGALLGALAGGVTGNAIGEAKDDQEYAEYQQASAIQAQQQAVTNVELIMMVQNQVSDDVIIGTVKSRGAQIDLSPSAIIELKNNGVSDRVILGIQDAARLSPPATTTVVAPSRVQSSIVVVRPVPVIGIGITRGHHHHCAPPRRHVHYHF